MSTYTIASIENLLAAIGLGLYEPTTPHPTYLHQPSRPLIIDLRDATSTQVENYAKLLKEYEIKNAEYRLAMEKFKPLVDAYKAECKTLKEQFEADCLIAVFGSELPNLAKALYNYAADLDGCPTRTDLVNTLESDFLPIYQAAIKDKLIKQR